MPTQASAQDHFRQGCDDLESGAVDRALAHFRSASRLDPGSARYRSYHGLALGLAERRWEKALELCRSAARDEFFEPGHYLNLARLHLSFGFKAEAIRLLRRGMMIAPGHGEIAGMLRELGVRRRPPLPFLRRDNALNRWLGTALERMRLRSEPEPEVALVR